MNQLRLGISILAVTVLLPVSFVAAEGARSWQLHNRLSIEYDDNIRESERNKSDSWKIANEIELLYNFNLENTFLSFRYKPSFVWWEDRDEDSTDIHHDLDFIFNHRFSPRWALDIKDTFRVADLPEVIDDTVTVREKSDFLYNSFNATLSYRITPTSRLEFGGRYNLLRYDDSDVATREDYDMYVGGVTYRLNVLPETALVLDGRFERIEYDDEFDRGSDIFQFGIGTEHMFSPNFLANARVGYMTKDFNDNEIDDETQPYGDMNVTFVPSPDTRVSLGLGYSMVESDIFPYASQDRLRFSLALAHDITARLMFQLSGSYARAKYDVADAIPGRLAELGLDLDDFEGGTENIYRATTRFVYRLNRSNWLEFSWIYAKLDSEEQLRRDFERNRFNVAWKTRL